MVYKGVSMALSLVYVPIVLNYLGDYKYGVWASILSILSWISYFDLGYATGEMAYEVLVEGADPATMQIRFAPQFTKIYNPTNCEALNITVPEDYIALG